MKSPVMMINLLSAVYWFDEALQAALKAGGFTNTTRAQSLLIANIAAGEHRAIRIARNLGVTRQAISQMLAELEAKGLVTVAADPNDRRARIVQFSDAATPTRQAARAVLDHLEQELVRRLGLQPYIGLRDALMMDWGDSPDVPLSVVTGADMPTAG